MNFEIWSDIVCPWCYIGKRRLESALSQFEHRNEVSITWRSFELDPAAPVRNSLPLEEMLAQKYGMTPGEARAANERVTELAAAEGLEYHLDQAHSANSFNAHRLIHLAAAHGLQGEMKERLMRAHFTEGVAVGESDLLLRLAKEVGLDEGETRELLAGDLFAEEVRGDEAAARSYGISGVPFFLVEGRWGISGAQPAEVFSRALEQLWGELHSTSGT